MIDDGRQSLTWTAQLNTLGGSQTNYHNSYDILNTKYLFIFIHI